MDIIENLLESLYNDVDAIYESGIIDFDEDYDRITIDIRDMDKSATMSRTFDAMMLCFGNKQDALRAMENALPMWGKDKCFRVKIIIHHGKHRPYEVRLHLINNRISLNGARAIYRCEEVHEVTALLNQLFE